MSNDTPIVARGGKSGLLKASKTLVLFFVDLLPLISLLLKNMHTSGILKCPATNKDPNKLSTASFLSSKIGIYEPVTMTVLFKFSNINERAEAVYAIVSVPCKTINPS